jgi:nicotinate-nucleotide pyrophosphorylase (carboxylating)
MLDAGSVRALVAAALAEDIGSGDATTLAIVPAGRRARARVVAKAAGVLAGRSVFEAVFQQLDADCRVEGKDDTSTLQSGEVIWQLEGPARALLAGERVALNFVQHMAGIATRTAQFVRAVQGTGVVVTDTRKTTPGLRSLEKYAVRCGGGQNHRSSLDTMLLVKENHIAAAGSLEQAVQLALRAANGRPVEVEVRELDELRKVIALGVERVLLDHWTPEEVQRALDLRGSVSRPQIEVSGNLTLETIRAFALPGVQFLSVGALTHSAPALDLSLLFEDAGEGEVV